MKILYLCRKETYLTKIARERFHCIEAIGRLSNLIFTGPGWDNYNDAATVGENIASLYGDDKPDLVIAFPSPVPLPGLKELSIKKCYMYNEMRTSSGELADLREINEAGIDIIICHFLNEINDAELQRHCKAHLIHIPMCANPSIFRDYQLKKEFDFTLFGSLDAVLYPLREKLVSALSHIKKTTTYRCRIYECPEVFRSNFSKEEHLVHFAKAINMSRICQQSYSASGKYTGN